MKIYVRRRHIEKGAIGHPQKCPIALAYEAATGELPRVFSAVISTDERKFILPRLARQFIMDFDSGKPVKPFAFTIRA